MRPLTSILSLLVLGTATVALAENNGPPEQFVKLHSDDIRSIIIGAWRPDWSVKQSFVQYFESFGANGVWQSTREERGPLMLEGLWTIQGDNLCVKITKATWGEIGGVQCRPVWRSPVSGDIAMADMGSGIKGETVIVLEPVSSERQN